MVCHGYINDRVCHFKIKIFFGTSLNLILYLDFKSHVSFLLWSERNKHIARITNLILAPVILFFVNNYSTRVHGFLFNEVSEIILVEVLADGKIKSRGSVYRQIVFLVRHGNIHGRITDIEINRYFPRSGKFIFNCQFQKYRPGFRWDEFNLIVLFDYNFPRGVFLGINRYRTCIFRFLNYTCVKISRIVWF